MKYLTELKRKRAMESIVFTTEKRDGTIKARLCANGITHWTYILCEEKASPIATTEAMLIIVVLEAKQSRDVVTLDMPNVFVQTDVPQSSEKIIIKEENS